MTKAVVVLSGGMDSTTLLYEVLNYKKSDTFGEKLYSEVYAISFYYGQRHQLELLMAAATCSNLKVPHKVCNLEALNALAPSALTRKDRTMPTGHYAAENMKETVVPNRNMVLLSLAAAYAIGLQVQDLYYGAHSGDHAIYPDCRQDFIDSARATILLADWHQVHLKAPYWDKDKGDIAMRGKALKVDYALTWTCYDPQPEDYACGVCGACVERKEAFVKADLEDPIKYKV